MGPWQNTGGATAVAVAISAEASEAFVVGDFSKGSVQYPATMTATTGQWQSSNDGENWTNNSEAAHAISANKLVKLPASMFAAKYARLQFNAAEAAARSLICFLSGPAAS